MGVKIKEKQPGSGVWWVYINHGGKRKAKKIGSKETARKVAEKIEAKLTLGDVGIMDRAKNAPTLEAYYGVWMPGHVTQNLKPNTRDRYRYCFQKHILPRFGRVPLDRLTRRDVKELILETREQGLKKTTVDGIVTSFSSLLASAIDDGYISTNPAGRLGKYNKKPPQTGEEILPFSEEQLILLLGVIEKDWSSHYPLFVTLAKTGMRIGEALGLEWPDIDWKEEKLYISKNWTGGHLVTPKTGRNRWVDLSPHTLQVLREHHFRVGRPAEGTVFQNVRGGRMFVTNVRDRVLYPALEKARISRRGLHQFRHSYATISLMRGVHFMYVSEQLGHKDPQVTLKVYAKWIPSPDRRGVVEMDKIGRKKGATGRNPDATTGMPTALSH